MTIQDDFQREERRSILLAGLAIILLVLAFSPIGSLLSFSLTLLAFFWVIYAIGMTVYFSDDLFQTRTRRLAKAIALTSIFVYPFAVVLEILSAAATAFALPYVSALNWTMVAAGTAYAILIGGRIFRFHATTIAAHTTPPPASTALIEVASNEKLKTTRQRRHALVEKIPKPTISPLPAFPTIPSMGTPLPAEAPTLKRNKKQKNDEPEGHKRPLGPTTHSARTVPPEEDKARSMNKEA